MDEREIAVFVIGYYKDDPRGHCQELKIILGKNPTIFNHMNDAFGTKHMLYKLYLSSVYFNAEVLKDIQDSLDFRQLLLTVRKYPESIRYIDPNRRSYKRLVQEALSIDGTVIRFINNPSPDLKRLAISRDPYFRNPFLKIGSDLNSVKEGN